MPVIRATMLFVVPTIGGRQGGFSESWYQDGTPASVMLKLKEVCPFRAGALPSTSAIIGQRVQQVGGRAVTDNANFPGVLRGTTDVPQMAAQCSVLTADGTKKKTFSCRGIIDDAVLGGTLNRNSTTVQNLLLFMFNLAGNNFQWRARDLSQPTVKIVTIDANGVFRLQADLPFVVGDFLTAVRVKSQQGRSIVGSFYVGTRVDAQNGTLVGWPTGQTVSFSGQFRKQAFIYPAVGAAGGTVDKVMVRKVGRPFFQYRGRATRRR